MRLVAPMFVRNATPLHRTGSAAGAAANALWRLNFTGGQLSLPSSPTPRNHRLGLRRARRLADSARVAFRMNTVVAMGRLGLLACNAKLNQPGCGGKAPAGGRNSERFYEV